MNIQKMVWLILLLMWCGLGGVDRARAEADDRGAKPIMVDAESGWKMVATDNDTRIQRTRDGGRHWASVSPLPLADVVKKNHPGSAYDASYLVDLCPLDADEAWIAITTDRHSERAVVLVEHTVNGGKSWQESTTEALQGQIVLSFVNSREGFMLALGEPSTGMMRKELYRTIDGGQHWEALPPPSAPGCYPTGIVFRSTLDGWITATYHGGDEAPLYRTHDGGKSWSLQKLPIPADFRGGYANTYPPVFIRGTKSQGYLPVKLVRHEPKPGREAWVNFETEDGGKSWQLPASGVPSTPDE